MAPPPRKKPGCISALSDDAIYSTLVNLDQSDLEAVNLDQSDLEASNDDDEEEEPAPRPRIGRKISNNGNGIFSSLLNITNSDDTDSDPDYVPESSSGTDEDLTKSPESLKKRKKNQPKRKKPSKQNGGGDVAQAKGETVTKKKKQDGPPWRQGDFSPEPISLQQPSYLEEDHSNWGPEKYIQQYIDDDILSLIAEKTNQTYLFRTGKILNLTLREFKVWLGINFVTSALQLPQIRMYWEKNWRVPVVADVMSRDGFFLIRNSIKVVFDNEVDEEQRRCDRLWKVRPLLSRILQGCLKQKREQHICIDEMMVPFSGTCQFKQYIPSKPNPEGVKVFALANPNGLVCDFNVYQGKATFADKELYQCENAVLQLCKSLVPGHVVYFDKFFTTIRLAEQLLDLGLHCTGTIRKDRLPDNTDLASDKILKKAGRGATIVTVREDKAMAISKWTDNNVVSMVSTHESSEPMCQVKRWSKHQKQYINVPQPKVINSYNCYMGGVDLADRIISYCPSRARTNKWTLRCILHFFDLAISNSWIHMRDVMRSLGVPAKKIPQFRKFKLDVGKKLIQLNDESERDEGEESEEEEEPTRHYDRRCASDPSIEERHSGTHLPEVSKGFQKRCAFPKCVKKSTIFCIKCNVYLCLVGGRNCFRKYHSK